MVRVAAQAWRGIRRVQERFYGNHATMDTNQTRSNETSSSRIARSHRRQKDQDGHWYDPSPLCKEDPLRRRTMTTSRTQPSFSHDDTCISRRWSHVDLTQFLQKTAGHPDMLWWMHPPHGASTFSTLSHNFNRVFPFDCFPCLLFQDSSWSIQSLHTIYITFTISKLYWNSGPVPLCSQASMALTTYSTRSSFTP